MHDMLIKLTPTTYTPWLFELYLSGEFVSSWTTSIMAHANLVYYLCVVYVIAIHVGQWYMRDKERYEMKKFLGRCFVSSIYLGHLAIINCHAQCLLLAQLASDMSQ